MKRRKRSVLGAVSALSVLSVACSSGTAGDEVADGDVGGTGQGGSEKVDSGGSVASGGSHAGGSAASGGKEGGGGSAGSGGRATGSGGISTSVGGGATGSGGSTGTGGAPAVVLPCPSGPATGTWERIGPPASLGSEVESMSVVLDPKSAGTLYGGFSRGNGVWKSADCGATWAHVATGRNAKLLESGSQWQMAMDRDTSDLYALSGYGGFGLYKSTNGGVDWDDVTPDTSYAKNANTFSMDPMDPRHLLVGYHQGCSAPPAPSVTCFAETTDGGATWGFVRGPTLANPGSYEGSNILVVSGGTWIFGYPYDAAYMTQDSGVHWKQVVGYSGCFAGLVSIAGTYYYGCYDPSDGIQEFKPGADTFTKLANSPRASALTVTGQYLYASLQLDSSGQPVYRAPLSDLTSWARVATPTIANGASSLNMPYDGSHQILYLAGWSGGLWRVSTP